MYFCVKSEPQKFSTAGFLIVSGNVCHGSVGDYVPKFARSPLFKWLKIGKSQ